MKKNIGIVGYGYLGQAFEMAFSPKCNIKINDVKFDADNKKFFEKRDLIGSDLILIGVPTPYSKKSGVDTSILIEVLNELNRSVEEGRRQLVCIKSAFPPSLCEDLRERFRKLIITVSPEYLSGKDNIRDMLNHEVLIVGSDNEFYSEQIFDLFINHSVANKNVKTGHCTPEEACLIKYMENAFLSLKCVFMSEFYLLHQKYKNKGEFNEVLRLWMLDSRMGNYPYKIPYEDDPLGYCSHCLCKDERTIRDEGATLNSPLKLLESMHVLNEIFRKEKDFGHKRCEQTSGGVVE